MRALASWDGVECVGLLHADPPCVVVAHLVSCLLHVSPLCIQTTLADPVIKFLKHGFKTNTSKHKWLSCK